jgi:pyrroline-5-carboxylate reductase
MISPDGLPYRPCVGVMLLNRDGLVFVGRRIVEQNSELEAQINVWQMPQGGIDKGETAIDAAKRELYEETGVKNAVLMCGLDGWFTYDLPAEVIGVALRGKYRGQTQRWFVFEFEGEDSEINLNPTGEKAEFDGWAWKLIDELPNLVVPFKRALYEEVIAAFKKQPPLRTIVLAGCGNMGFAMLQGWCTAKAVAFHNIHVVEPHHDLRERAKDYGVNVYNSVTDLPKGLKIDLVVLAVKPQIMAQILPDYQYLAQYGTAFLTVAAGLTIQSYEDILGENVPIIRCMPNTPAAINKGMIVYCSNKHASVTTTDLVENLLECSGAFFRIHDETLMDGVTAVSGSGPAYVFYFIECLINAGIQLGLEQMVAEGLAIQTVIGAGMMADLYGKDVQTLRENVTSPNGTTQAALNVLMREHGLQELMNEAVKAAYKRSIEMSAT